MSCLIPQSNISMLLSISIPNNQTVYPISDKKKKNCQIDFQRLKIVPFWQTL